jgi:hypothetical protein
MRQTIFLLALVLLVSACGGGTGSSEGASWQGLVDAMSTLIAPLAVPDHLQAENAEKRGDEFDANAFFTVLDRLSPQSGHVLDYVYCYDFMGGYPMLYVRPEGATPYRTCSEHANALDDAAGSGDRYDYLEEIQVDGTAEGFFQLALLRVMGNQFYLHWHANYNDALVICNQEGLEKILSSEGWIGDSIPDDVKESARELDLAPVVEFSEDAVSVHLTIFTKWGGFIRLHYSIQREFPHKFLDFSEETLVPYDCGIQF